MRHVLQFVRVLAERPELPAADGVSLRTYGGSADIELWLRIRQAAFADETPTVRPWTETDFSREFLRQPWWRPDRMWFAEAQPESGPSLPVGTVTLAVRDSTDATRAAVHWLAICPPWRARGIARFLLARCEQSCWDAGHRIIHAETHASWRSAVLCYESLGYERAVGL